MSFLFLNLMSIKWSGRKATSIMNELSHPKISLTNKYLYIIPGGMLLVSYLCGWIQNLIVFFNPDAYFGPKPTILALSLLLISIIILILALLHAYKSKPQTVWFALAVAFLGIVGMGFNCDLNLLWVIHLIEIVLSIMLLVVALWDILKVYRANAGTI